MKKLAAVAVVMTMCCSTAWAAGTTHVPSNGLIFGNGTLTTGVAKPGNGQAVCNINGVLAGCAGGGGGGGSACSGSVLLNNMGSGAIVNTSCITPTSNCVATDTTSATSYNNPISTQKPTAGGITVYNGVPGDTVRVTCQ